MNNDRIADVGVGSSWAVYLGITLTQVNEVLTALSLLAATFASIAAGVYYLSKRKKDS